MTQTATTEHLKHREHVQCSPVLRGSVFIWKLTFWKAYLVTVCAETCHDLCAECVWTEAAGFSRTSCRNTHSLLDQSNIQKKCGVWLFETHRSSCCRWWSQTPSGRISDLQNRDSAAHLMHHDRWTQGGQVRMDGDVSYLNIIASNVAHQRSSHRAAAGDHQRCRGNRIEWCGQSEERVHVKPAQKLISY